MAKWAISKKAGNAPDFAKKLSISPILARVLINRGITTERQGAAFLSPDMPALEDVEHMSGVTGAYEIIRDAIESKTKVYIYGDYDVDGVMSTVILYKTLTEFNADVHFCIPDRHTEGYGLNLDAVTAMREKGCGLLITCDNGIASTAEIALARQKGIKTIVIDHHEDGGAPPPADAVIDPKRAGCAYKFKQMCAAGIVFRFVCGLYGFLGAKNPNYNEYLTLAAIATFCDIVDLTGENRAIAKEGLRLLNKEITNLGLKALIDERGLKKAIGEYEVGFIIGPCINAAGRLETADVAVKLLLTDNADTARELARELAGLNDRRKQMTDEACETAIINYNKTEKQNPVIIVYDADIDESVAGIVAGRLKDKTRRPVIVLTDSSACGIAKGSARSVEGYDIFGELSKCAHLFERFGGHTMAAGLSLKKEHIAELERILNGNCRLTQSDFEEKIIIDAELGLGDITYATAKELSLLAPYGKDNREPLFGTKGARVSELKIYAEKNTIRFTFDIAGSYRKLTAVCFGKLDDFTKMINENYESRIAQKVMSGVLRQADLTLDIVYSIGINEYNNSVSVNLKIKDFRKGV